MIELNDRMMKMGGEQFRIERQGEKLLRVEGLRNRDTKQVKFYPGTDVRPGDWLITDSGKRLYIYDTDVLMINRKPFAHQAFYRTEAEQNAATVLPELSQNFIFNAPSYGVFGSQQDFQFEQVVRDLDRQIEERGGEDTDALKAMVEEIRNTLEGEDSISRSQFEKWSELANKHAPWLLSPLGSLFVNYVFGVTAGG